MDIDQIAERAKKWIERQYLKPPGNHDLARLRLLHLGSRNSELWSVDIEGNFNPDNTAFELAETAWDDASGMGGVQKYKVEAFYGDSKKPGRIHRFAIDARGDNLDSEFSEPATSNGIVAQTMRHNEHLMRMAIGGSNAVIQQLGRQVEIMSKRMLAMEEKLWQGVEAREKLLTQAEEREIMRMEAEGSEKRKDEVLDTVKTLLPAVVDRMSHKALGPGSPEGEKKMQDSKIAAFMESLTPEQKAEIGTVLKPHQLAALVELGKKDE